MCTEFWLDTLKGRDNSEDQDINGRILLKWILGKQGLGMWIGFIWLRIGMGGRTSWAYYSFSRALLHGVSYV
jgi:hypothetical protein